jgi:hypothetical protein
MCQFNVNLLNGLREVILAEIVSVNWNVEEFRKLIAEQPHPDEKSVAGEATVQLLGIEIDVSDKALPTHRGTANKNSHSITGQAQVPEGSNPTNPITNTLLATVIISNERTGKPVPHQPAKAIQISTGSTHRISQEIEKADFNFGAQQGPPVPALPAQAGMPNRLDPALESNLRQSTTDPIEAHDEHWALREAILKPTIHTGSADRDRAMRLRWALRDIAANRLKLSPISDLDFRTLVELKLVEIKDNILLLTSDGAAATK